MQAYIGIITLCAVSGILSCIVHEICNKDRSGTVMDKSYIDHIIKTTVFYIIMFYTILSLFKVILGNASLTLVESFDEISRRTYLHYSIPLVIISVAAPFILIKFLREKTEKFVLMVLSLIIGIDSIVYLFFDEINNIWHVCAAVVGVVLALLSVYYYKGKVSYCTPKTLKKRLKLIVPVISLWVVLIVLYLPNELYLRNADEMEVPYDIFVQSLLIGGLLYLIIYTFILVYFLTGKQFILACEVIFAISVGCLIQSMGLNGKMNLMDGSVQTWDLLTKTVNILIWAVIIGIIIALKFITKKNVVKTYSKICIYLSLIQLVTWGYLGIVSNVERANSDYQMTTEGRLELDPDHNVIVFVLDWYDGQILDRVIEDDENFIEPLKDFTWYKNMSSMYAFTGMSLPYMLTGVEWQYDMTEKEYSNYAFGNGTYLYDIAEKNYDIGVYTFERFISKDMIGVIRNYSDVKLSGWRRAGIFKQMLKCAKYKSYPFALKTKYWYADGEMARAMHETSVHSVSYDEPFYNDLLYNGIKIRKPDSYDGAFRFYHLHGVHVPFEPDMISQAKFCTNIVYEYLEQLKALGLYDEATIIITADHGQNYVSRVDMLAENNLERASSPILFVKKSGQTNEIGPEVSMAPVSHMELPASIIEAVYGDTLEYGDAFEDIDEDAERTRYFINRRYSDIPYEKYAISGYARDWNNWTLLEHD
ncbi:MAG: alkaline phosphatase family protein [Lachnospiraceae bacterium]|nr:alkaline phosphatase family protein [Lachnospiraceae bacterium]